MLKFSEDFIKNYDEDSDKGYFLKLDIEYLLKIFWISIESLHNLHSDLPFLAERMKVNKCNKLVCNLYDKNNYVIHVKSLKQALNHGLIFKKVHRVIEFNQEAWLKEYIDMNTELREKKQKMILRKRFL